MRMLNFEIFRKCSIPSLCFVSKKNEKKNIIIQAQAKAQFYCVAVCMSLLIFLVLRAKILFIYEQEI